MRFGEFTSVLLLQLMVLDLTMNNFVKKRKAKSAAAPKAAASVAPGHVLSDNQLHKLNMISRRVRTVCSSLPG